ncbi:MAG: hypothetical protein J5614_04590 [Paludibacteraceae bacterium]|nr:hypothetical protein [Paludibacteraceae bacterium]
MIKKNGKTIQHIYKHIHGVLPDAYQEVAYLRSDGNQRIDLQVFVDSNLTVNTKIQTKGGYSDSSVFGFLLSENNTAGRRFSIYKNNNSLFVGIGNSASQRQYDGKQNLLNNVCSLIATKDGISIDGELFATNNADIDWQETITFRVFGRYSNGTYNKSFIGDIYNFRVENQYDLIPCYRKSDNVPGMYDVINDTFYTNAGTGEFTCGGVVKDNKILQIKDSQGRVIHRDI